MKTITWKRPLRMQTRNWVTELMVLVADKILKWYDDDFSVDAAIITQENETILIDISPSRLHMHHLLHIV